MLRILETVNVSLTEAERFLGVAGVSGELVISPSERTLSVVQTIWATESYRIFRFKHAQRVRWAIIALIGLNLFATWFLSTRLPPYRYIFTDQRGQIVDLAPLDQPKQNDEYVMRWAINAVVESYTFDFKNYQRQLFAAQNDLTFFGWQEWKKALLSSGNFRAVLGNKYVATAAPTGRPEIVKRGLFNGRYAWRVRFPMLVVYQSSAQRTNQDLMIEVVVVRQPEYVNISGLGVRQIVALGGSS